MSTVPAGPDSGGFEVVAELHEGAEDLLFMPDATASDWAQVFAHAEPFDFEPGDEIVRAGERERALYLLVEGRLGVRVPSAAERLKAIDAPSVVGELSFVDGEPRSATLEGLSAGTVVRLDMDGFERLAAAEPVLARRFLLDLARVLAARLRMLTERH
jgi:CRP/FNR family transcriptional regulator, cyclic AMP receptor protein